MAQIFRAFKMPGKHVIASSHTSGLRRQVSPDSQVSVTGVAPYVCDTGEVNDDNSDASDVEDEAEVKVVGGGFALDVTDAKLGSAAKVLKNGFASIRERISVRLRSQCGGISLIDGAKYASESSSSQPPIMVNRVKYDLFRNEMSKSVEVSENVSACISKLGLERKYDHEGLHKTFARFCDRLFVEAWRVAEYVFREERERAQKQLQESEQKHYDALTSYMKDVTALRDQIRHSDHGITEALAVSFFTPLDYVDESTRKLVHACVDERLRDVICEVNNKRCSSFAGLSQILCSRLYTDTAAKEQDLQEEQQKGVLALELEEQKKLVAQLEQKLQTAQVDLNHSLKELSELRAMLQDEARRNTEQTLVLRAELEKVRLEKQELADRLKLASASVAVAEASVSLPEVQQAQVSVPPASQVVADSDDACLNMWVSSLTLNPELAPDDFLAQILLKFERESQTVLRGASAAYLMEHAAKFGTDSSYNRVHFSDADLHLLAIIVCVIDRVAKEIQEESSAVSRQLADKLSLFIGLLELQADVARRQSLMLFILASLMHQALLGLFSIATGTAVPQAKVTQMTEKLKEIRCKSKHHILSCLSAAEQGYAQLEHLRQELRCVTKSGEHTQECRSPFQSPCTSEGTERWSSPPTGEKTEAKATSYDLRAKRSLSGILDALDDTIDGAAGSPTFKKVSEHYDSLQPAMTQWKKAKAVTSISKVNSNRMIVPGMNLATSSCAPEEAPRSISAATEIKLSVSPQSKPMKPGRPEKKSVAGNATRRHSSSRSPTISNTLSKPRRVLA